MPSSHTKIRYLPLTEVQRIAGNASRTTIWRWAKAGIFPKPSKLGPNRVGWNEEEVIKWAKSRQTTS